MNKKDCLCCHVPQLWLGRVQREILGQVEVVCVFVSMFFTDHNQTDLNSGSDVPEQFQVHQGPVSTCKV